MNIDIQTEHVRMQPEWHRTIDDWLARCRRKHPDVASIDVTLRHGEPRDPGDEVTIDAVARGRHVHGTSRAPIMGTALQEALDAVEQELLVHEAVTRRV